EGAYQLLRQTAMNQGRRIPDVAQALLSLADVLPPR
ncbi:MAG: ANTAR domain-containing protein, partial [Burkholderiaceae bacterium]|nr:ANTAR domain-containing protein [Burkholderiaceae bacterium]